MSQFKVSEFLLAALAKAGVKHVFGIVGDALNSITDAMRRDGKIQWLSVRHEETAAFAAGAQAQLTGQLGVCMGTVGPGAIHLLNGLYDAKQSHTPVLAVTGQIPLQEIGTDYVQEVNLLKLFDDVSVFNQMIVSPAQMPQIADAAIRTALAQGGVAHLCIPGNIGQAVVPAIKLQHEFYQSQYASLPTAPDLEKAAAVLNAATRITILGGIGTQGAKREILAVAERLKAPLVYALRGKDVLEYDNPYAVGMTGVIGIPPAANALEAADTLLLVGTDFPYRDWIPRGKRVVQIDNCADRIGRRTHIDAGLIGDARWTLQSLLPLLKDGQDEEHLRRAQKARDDWQTQQLKRIHRQSSKSPIRPELLAKTISDLADDDAIFCVDTGMCVVWAARCLEMRVGRRLLGSFKLASMANALPQAIGAQALYPDRQVITFSGDGGLTMLMGDLLTAVSYRLPIKFFIFNNQRFGMVKLEMETDGYPEFGTILQNPDFVKMAEAIGMKGIHIKDPQQIREGVKNALATEGPVLVDVKIHSEELFFPPKLLPNKAMGYAIGKVKEMLSSTHSNDKD